MTPNSATTSTLSTQVPQAPGPQAPVPPSPQPHAAFDNLQSSISNLQSDVHSVHNVHPVHPSYSPHSDIPHSPSLHARGLALFSTLLELVEMILAYMIELITGNQALPNSRSLSLLGKAIGCLYSLTRLRLTLLRAPQRFTARQVLRLSRVFVQIRHLTGQAFDFSPWTALTPEELDALSPKKSPSPSSGNLQSTICNQQSPSPSPSPSNSSAQSVRSDLPQSEISNLKSAIPDSHSSHCSHTSHSSPIPHSVFPIPHSKTPQSSSAAPAAKITATPGATLARICEDMLSLAKALCLPHHHETGFLPVQSPSPSSSNLQSTICNPQSSPSPSVHDVHDVHPVHPVHFVHCPSPVFSPIPHSNSFSPALRRQLAAPIRAPV